MPCTRLSQNWLRCRRRSRKRLISPSGHPYRGVHLKRDDSGTVRQERFLATRYDGPQEAIDNGVAPELADFFDPNVWPAEVPALTRRGA